MTFKNVLLNWNLFLFEPKSPLNLCLLRIFYGFFLLSNFLLIWPDRFIWFSDQGFWSLSQSLQEVGVGRLNLMNWLSESWQLDLWFVFGIAVSVFVILGFCSNVAIGLSFLMLTSMAHRNNLILSGSDTLLRLIGFFLMWSKSGLGLSIDAKLKKHPQLDPKDSEPWVMRVLQIQLCLIYFVTVYWKLQGQTWQNGTAVGIVLNMTEFERFPLPAFVRGLAFSQVATFLTLVVEALFPVFVWFKDTRKFALIAGASLHLGLEYCLNIQLFQPVILSLYVLFIDPESIKRFLKKIGLFVS